MPNIIYRTVIEEIYDIEVSSEELKILREPLLEGGLESSKKDQVIKRILLEAVRVKSALEGAPYENFVSGKIIDDEDGRELSSLEMYVNP